MVNSEPEAVPDPEPSPPREPDPSECCGSGCESCVFDLYWEALERYERAMRERKSGRGSAG
jgi:hypothetical protein